MEKTLNKLREDNQKLLKEKKQLKDDIEILCKTHLVLMGFASAAMEFDKYLEKQRPTGMNTESLVKQFRDFQAKMRISLLVSNFLFKEAAGLVVQLTRAKEISDAYLHKEVDRLGEELKRRD